MQASITKDSIEERIEFYYVIYTVDTCNDVSLNLYQPPELLKKRDGERIWGITEEGECEYSYLEGDWEPGKHRKYVGMLTPDEFKHFVFMTGMWMEDIQTMGSLTELGWLPAVSFNGDWQGYGAQDAIINAYVTPLIQTTEGDPDELWDHVFAWMLDRYGS